MTTALGLRIGRVLHRPTHTTVSLRRRVIAWSATAVVLLVAVAMLALAVPLPFLEGFLAAQVTDRVRGQVACPGASTRATVAVKGGRLLPQLLRKRFDELQLSVPDATLSGVRHAAFAATMRDVSQPTADSAHAASMDATIKVGFANMPTTEGEPVPTYRRSPDGGLTVDVVVPAANSDSVKAKLFLKMRLNGETVESVPQQLEIFGRTLPAADVAELTGGVRTQQLPELPAGVDYQSISPRKDGLHVALAGVSTTALSTLPPEVGGNEVTYAADDGLLGIATSVGVKPIINIPLTVFTAPKLSGSTLTLEPQSVHILGKTRKLGDPLAKLVLTQIKQEDLTRELPALPSGVAYRSVSVDSGGIRLVINGTTVKPFSALRQPDRPTAFGAENGMLTATAQGSGEDTPIVLHARPRISGSTLDIAPEQIEMFGARFPASNVLSEVKAQDTTYRLQELPANLAYQSVTVLSDGLLIRLSGRDVTLTKGALTGGTC
jgi:hypothetical protein